MANASKTPIASSSSQAVPKSARGGPTKCYLYEDVPAILAGRVNWGVHVSPAGGGDPASGPSPSSLTVVTKGSTESSKAPCGATNATSSSGEKRTVLFADDVATIRLVAATVLGNAGFSVLQAKDGVEALELFHAHRDEICVVVTDAMMPGMKGTELVNRIRATDTSTPIIFTSGYRDEDVPKSPRVQPMPKPYLPSTLLRTIAACLAADDSSEELPIAAK